MNADTRLDESVLILLDEPWACGSSLHGSDSSRHDDGPATHYQFGLCEHGTGGRCARYMRALLPGVDFLCPVCGLLSSWESHRWVPITKESPDA